MTEYMMVGKADGKIVAKAKTQTASTAAAMLAVAVCETGKTFGVSTEDVMQAVVSAVREAEKMTRYSTRD